MRRISFAATLFVLFPVQGSEADPFSVIQDSVGKRPQAVFHGGVSGQRCQSRVREAVRLSPNTYRWHEKDASHLMLRKEGNSEAVAVTQLDKSEFGQKVTLLTVDSKEMATPAAIEAVEELVSGKADYFDLPLDIYLRSSKLRSHDALSFPIVRQTSPVNSVRKAKPSQVGRLAAAEGVELPSAARESVFLHSNSGGKPRAVWIQRLMESLRRDDSPDSLRILVGKPKFRRWNVDLDFSKIEETLARSKIIGTVPMHNFMAADGKIPRGRSGTVLFVEFEDGTRGVWKPSKGDGTTEAEIGAYAFSKYTRMNLVPPTVRRAHQGRDGSVQLFVESGNDFKKFPERQPALEALLSEKEKSDRQLFYFIFGNWDRHDGNMIIDNANALALIDNAEAKAAQRVRYGEAPFVAFAKLRIDPSPAAKSKFTGLSDFPFDQARIYQGNEIRRIKSDFENRLSTADRARLGHRLESHSKPTSRVAVIEWDGRLWMTPPNLSPAATSVYSQRTLNALSSLSEPIVRSFYSGNVPDEIISGVLERARQVLEAAKNGKIIP